MDPVAIYSYTLGGIASLLWLQVILHWTTREHDSMRITPSRKAPPGLQARPWVMAIAAILYATAILLHGISLNAIGLVLGSTRVSQSANRDAVIIAVLLATSFLALLRPIARLRLQLGRCAAPQVTIFIHWDYILVIVFDDCSPGGASSVLQVYAGLSDIAYGRALEHPIQGPWTTRCPG
ncbi:hypothetical protein BDV19DRAFT_393376 [Aspergillus venezuelensis]